MATYLVGEMLVSVGQVKTDAGWVEDWAISIRGEDGTWYADAFGQSEQAGEYHAPEREVPLGVEEARRRQGDIGLPFEMISK